MARRLHFNGAMTREQETAREYWYRCSDELAVAAQRARHEPSKLNDAKQREAETALKNAYLYARELGVA